MKIRPANFEDFPVMMPIYERARSFMASCGNALQWGSSYPPKKLLEADIKNGQLYLCMEADRIAAVFMFFLGEEPNYARIEDGCWPNELPYGTIHRLASAGIVPGSADFCIRWCMAQCSAAGAALRGDTHGKNLPMQHVFEKNGFQKCGIVHMTDGTPRIAYQKTVRFHTARWQKGSSSLS